MKAVLKSKIIADFDRAIADAEKKGYEIVCFKLETDLEREQLKQWLNDTGGYCPQIECNYEGIDILNFHDSEVTADICRESSDKKYRVLQIHIEDCTASTTYFFEVATKRTIEDVGRAIEAEATKS